MKKEKYEGAFIREVRRVVDEDFKEKTEFLEKMLKNPDKYKPMTGVEIAEFLFGDIVELTNKYRI